ncbi:MAG: hypothetical protein CMD58_03300 [Gammaproteobacteria bacterium]|nr:hypothetical protein [Gammaproteobacteria bacterium]
MKKLVLILFFIIPLHGFSQDLSGTGWKIYDDDGDKMIILFKKDNTFIYQYYDYLEESGTYRINVRGDSDETWSVDVNQVVFLFNDGYQIYSGEINNKGDYMSGTNINKKGRVTSWWGERIKF